MMSMKQEGKPVSFVEDCAVPLPHLADYTERLNAIFARHGTSGTMYAHASEGCLHVRPVLNLKLEKDVKAMRAIAEETFAMVREYKGSHSGEHGDGIVRSEFHEAMFGERIIADLAEVKQRFDPEGVLNPGKIVDPADMDDRSLFRYPPDYRVTELKTALDWSAYPGAGGGFQGAVEMCNNNGACRKLEGGVMCPSYRATRNEKDVTRGRANTLRLAISGQLGADALASDEMMDTMKLCVSCKACRHECPTRVDMTHMRIDQAGIDLDRLVKTYAPFAARGVPIVGLEPSCLLTLRDELLSLRSDDTAKNISAHALLFEEFLVREAAAGRLCLPLGPIADKALVHGHCHQKSFGAFKSVEQVLRLVPDLNVETIESSCCGMAGAFGYGADTYQTSLDMAELSLLPAVRRADTATLVVADGTSCRHQIKDGTNRAALHVARVLAMSLDNARSNPTASPVAKEPIHG